MKKFLRRTIFLAFMILITLASVNYVGDSAKLFNHKYEKQMANILKSGSYVTNISNFDERLFRKDFIESCDVSPNIVVIGSSRTLLINQSHFTIGALMNNSVSGASIEDLIAIYQLGKVNRLHPSKIILGIDPWTFNINNGMTRWQSIDSYYYQFTGIKNASSVTIEKYKQLISFSYFQSSIDEMQKKMKGNDMPLASNNRFNETRTILNDGSLVYGNSYRESSKETVNSRVELSLNKKLYGLEDFDLISESIWANFDMLLKDMQNEGIEVELFLSPYHPKVYRVMEKDYSLVIDLEKRLMEYSKAKSIKVTGSFNPKLVGLTQDEFYDAMHCNEIGIESILTNVVTK